MSNTLASQLPITHHRMSYILPARNAPSHGRHLVIAHLVHGFRRQQGARSTGTIDDDVFVRLRHFASDLEFQKATRHRHGAVDIAAADFIFLPHVQQNKILTAPAAFCHFLDAYLGNFLARCGEEVLLRFGHTVFLLLYDTHRTRQR